MTIRRMAAIATASWMIAIPLAIWASQAHRDHVQKPGAEHVTLSLGPVQETRTGARYGWYSLSSNRLIAPKNSGPVGQVFAVDLTTGRREEVARSRFPRGYINWAVGLGDWVVYVDQSHLQGDGPFDVLWRVVAANTATHETRLLWSNGNKPDPFVPQVYAAEGYVYWTSADTFRSARESLWRPEWTAPRDVVRRGQVAPASESVAQGWMYYQGTATTRRNDDRAADCWRMRLDGSDAKPLTTSGLVMDCRSDGTYLAWTEHIDTRKTPDAETSDDPYELWIMRIGGKPQVVHRGDFSYSEIMIANGYLVWQNEDFDVEVTSLKNPKASKVLGEGSTQTAVADGHTLVVFTSERGHDIANVIDLRKVKLQTGDR